MSDPTRGGFTRKKRSTQPKMSPEDSLRMEAYGRKGSAFRKTAATMGEGLHKAEQAADSSVVKKAISRVRGIFK